MTRLEQEVIGPGTRVDVCVRYDGSWSKGFEVLEVSETGYLLKRLSDGTQLPGVFPADDVRVSRRKQGLWWY